MKKFITLTVLLSLNTEASVESICSAKDSRIQMTNEPIARVSKNGINSGCTATLIGESCAITAGHCEDHLFKGEFNVPRTIDGIAQPAQAEDTYLIDKSTIVFNEGGRGDDWAVFKFKNNSITNLSPGQAYGFYEVELYEPKTQIDLLRISGYGVHWSDNTLSYTLMGATGYADYIGYSSEGRSLLNHYVDTTPAASGSSVINVKTNKIIGIHGQGGCGGRNIWNSGTLIKGHPSLQKAIKRCLETNQ